MAKEKESRKFDAYLHSNIDSKKDLLVDQVCFTKTLNYKSNLTTQDNMFQTISLSYIIVKGPKFNHCYLNKLQT